MSTSYALGGPVSLGYEQAIARIKETLQAEGFGVLCEIDIAATMRAKMNVEKEPYVILGVCNPALALDALGIEPDLGLLMPCNVVVSQQGEQVFVKVIEPQRLLSLCENPALDGIAADVRARLERALAAV